MSAITSTLTQETVALPGGREQIVWRGGEGPPLVWLHGGGGLDPAHPLLNALAAGHEVVAPLAPGFTDLSELDEIDDVHDLAIHYDDVLEALGIEDAVLAGHSFGGMVAAELAAHYPRRVSRLVLVAPIGLWNEAYPVTDMFAVPFPDLLPLLYVDPPPPPDTGGAEVDEQEMIEGFVTLARGMTSIAKFMWPIPDKGLAGRLYRVTSPALIVFGRQDAIVPARYAEDFVAALPDATSAIVDGAGHMVLDERTDEVRAAIEGFLARA